MKLLVAFIKIVAAAAFNQQRSERQTTSSLLTLEIDASRAVGIIAPVHNVSEGPVIKPAWIMDTTAPDKSLKDVSSGFKRAGELLPNSFAAILSRIHPLVPVAAPQWVHPLEVGCCRSLRRQVRTLKSSRLLSQPPGIRRLVVGPCLGRPPSWPPSLVRGQAGSRWVSTMVQ